MTYKATADCHISVLVLTMLTVCNGILLRHGCPIALTLYHDLPKWMARVGKRWTIGGILQPGQRIYGLLTGVSKTWRQAVTHIRISLLSYVKLAPFQPCSWEDLKARLLKRFQPQHLAATYKAQFRSGHCCQSEDLYSFAQAQCLTDVVWSFMECQAKEKLVMDQFFNGQDSHELSVQMVTNGYHHAEDMLHVTGP